MPGGFDRRLGRLREALAELAHAVDENLRTVLLLMTTEETVAASLSSRDTQPLSEALMDRSTEFLGLQGPVASDLRWATAVIRIGKDYERIAFLTEALLRRVQGLSGTLLDTVLHAMTALTREILGLHARILQLWSEEAPEVDELATAVEAHMGVIRERLRHVEDLGVLALMQGQAGAENLRELVLATRHLKRIADELRAIPDELRRR